MGDPHILYNDLQKKLLIDILSTEMGKCNILVKVEYLTVFPYAPHTHK